MTDWTALMAAGAALAQAYVLLDRANETGTHCQAAIITKSGLLDAARQAVIRANRQLGL